LGKKVELTLIKLVERETVDKLINSISRLIVGQPIDRLLHNQSNDDNHPIDDEYDNDLSSIARQYPA